MVIPVHRVCAFRIIPYELFDAMYLLAFTNIITPQFREQNTPVLLFSDAADIVAANKHAIVPTSRRLHHQSPAYVVTC